MKKIIFLIVMLAQIAPAQNSPSRYEAEMLKNPKIGGRDTREVNAVLIFEKDGLKITSRRANEIFKEFKYSEIKYVEHSFSKMPKPSPLTRSRLIGALFSDPLLFPGRERRWLTILTENDFAVLKIENDNFRLLRMEFMVRDLDFVNVNEDRQ